jgi:hypothetical protein
MSDSNTNKGQGTPATHGQSNAGQSTSGQGGQNQGNFAQGNFGRGGQSSQGNQGAGPGGVAQMARETAGNIGKGATDLMHSAADQAQHAAETVGGGMRSLAGTIREKAPSQGVLSSAAGTVAGTLDSSGRYLEQEGFSGMINDVSGIVRRNPMSSILCCLAVGFLVGKLVSLSANNSRSF